MVTHVLLMFETLKLLLNNNESIITTTLIDICCCNITWTMCAVTCLAHGSSNQQRADSAAEKTEVKGL